MLCSTYQNILLLLLVLYFYLRIHFSDQSAATADRPLDIVLSTANGSGN